MVPCISCSCLGCSDKGRTEWAIIKNREFKKKEIQIFPSMTCIVDESWHFCSHLWSDKLFAKTCWHAIFFYGEKTEFPFLVAPCCSQGVTLLVTLQYCLSAWWSVHRGRTPTPLETWFLGISGNFKQLSFSPPNFFFTQNFSGWSEARHNATKHFQFDFPIFGCCHWMATRRSWREQECQLESGNAAGWACFRLFSERMIDTNCEDFWQSRPPLDGVMSRWVSSPYGEAALLP